MDQVRKSKISSICYILEDHLKYVQTKTLNIEKFKDMRIIINVISAENLN